MSYWDWLPRDVKWLILQHNWRQQRAKMHEELLRKTYLVAWNLDEYQYAGPFEGFAKVWGKFRWERGYVGYRHNLLRRGKWRIGWFTGFNGPLLCTHQCTEPQFV